MIKEQFFPTNIYGKDVKLDNQLFANTVFPGLDIKYTLDGSEPSFSSKTYESPIEVQDSDIINLRLFDKTGRGGNAILVNK